MYGHVPQVSGRARMSGAVTAVALTIATGYGVMVAATRHFVPPVEQITQLFIMEPEKLQEVKPIPVETPKVVVEKPRELVAPPIVPPPEVQPVIVAPPAPAEPAPAPIVAPVASGNNRVAPKLITSTKPDYPLQSVRAEEQGTTHLEVCVTEAGRVQSVTVAQSSGHPRLDAAAASWMRSARFRPGSIGGVPQAMCGHDVYYDWNLKDVGRT